MVLFKDLEDMFYKVLKTRPRVQQPALAVPDQGARRAKGKDDDRRDVQARVKRRQDDFDLVIQAKRAVLHFDLSAKLVRVYFDDAEIQHYRHDADVVLINDRILEIPIPPDSKFDVEKKIQEFTNSDLKDELRDHERLIATERLRQAISSGVRVRTGRIDRINWGDVQGCVREPRVRRPTNATSSRPSGGSGSRWRAAACCS